MVNLARSLARSEGANGITANSVCPGWVDTEMAATDLAERGEAIRAEVPLGRVATPEDVAGAVLFYVSPLGSYANGTALPLNGGSFLH
jgi:3-oxoacyl-[acyl-carrier protein] reductase